MLRMTYAATGSGLGHAFAQIVDNTRNLALGNQVTPIPIKLDGATHTVTRKLDAVAASVGASSKYTLQIVGGSAVYGPVRTTAVLTVSHVRVALPTVATAAARHALLPASRRCGAGRRLRVTLKGALRSARVTVQGKRAHVARRKGHLRASRKVHGAKRMVRVSARATTKAGKKLRDSRRYRSCKGG
jgi:hypothetical protein